MPGTPPQCIAHLPRTSHVDRRSPRHSIPRWKQHGRLVRAAADLARRAARAGEQLRLLERVRVLRHGRVDHEHVARSPRECQLAPRRGGLDVPR